MTARTPGPWTNCIRTSLCAAAPDMYRACEMNACLHKSDGSECAADEGPCAARAAIAKARGGA